MNAARKPIVFSAPQAWGKTRRSEQLRQEFGCTSVIDDWPHEGRLTAGALHLTSMPPQEVRMHADVIKAQAQVVSRGWKGGVA